MLRIKTLALAAAALAASAGAAAADGRQTFMDNCSACHQPTGKGVPGAFPALVGSKIATGPALGAATIVMNGKGGMPSFRDELSDKEISEALTFVRSTWGNKAPPVTPAIVASVRGGGKRENPKAALTAH